MEERYEVRVAAGSRRSPEDTAVAFSHDWSPDGVTVEADFTGVHMLLVSAAGCVLNDVYREAEKEGLEIHGVEVTATGGFDSDTWRCTGITYHVDVSSLATGAELERLLNRVDSVAEIPRALRAGTTVQRAG